MSDVLPRLSTALADRYRVERELGAGGMATVYLAHDLKHERDVALKVLHPELAAVLGAERFLAEIKTTAKLQHPHILPLLDSGEAGGLLFYVMPVVDGESLRAHLQRETQLPVDDAVRITKEVGSALDYAHRHGVIHRDIKPENILLHDNSALVTDFGIALAVTAAGGARLTQTGLSLGTPQYMAPEQAMGEKSVDARADVYALGCVLYEMLAGQAPFTGPTAQAIVAQVLTTDALPVTTHRKTVPPNVARAVHAALQKLPADRFSTIAEFTGALDASVVIPATSGGIAAPRASRAVSWGVIAAGVASGVAIGAAIFNGDAPSSASRAPRFYQLALPDSAPFVAGVNRYDAALPSLAITPDGRSLAYIAGTPSGPKLALVRLDRGTVSVFRGTEGAYLPTFSPDGRSIAFVSGTKVQRLSIEDGSVTTLATIDYIFGLVWGGDGRIYMSGLEYDGVTCISAIPEAGGPVQPVGDSHCFVQSLARANASGTRLIATTGGNDPLYIDTKSGAIQTITAADGSPLRATGLQVMVDGTLLMLRDSSLLAARVGRNSRLESDPAVLMTNVRREAWTGTAHMALSDEGTMVWAPGGDAAIGSFVWLDAKGVRHGVALQVNARITSYALSPDENRIAYSTFDAAGRPRMFVADLRRGVTDDVKSDFDLQPNVWIRGGRALAATIVRAGIMRRRMIVDFSGSTPRLDTLPLLDDESRDGTQQCWQVFDERLELTTTAGGGKPVLVAGGRAGWCRFSPDGSRVAWATSAGIFAARTSSRVAESRVQVAPPGADEPRWSEDGRSIYYRNANQWFVVNAPSAGDMRPAGEPRLAFTGNYLQAWVSWERARSGRFLMIEGAAPLRLRTLNVMTNFPTLVEEKLKGSK